MRPLCKINSLNLVLVASCSTSSAPAGTITFNGTGAGCCGKSRDTLNHRRVLMTRCDQAMFRRFSSIELGRRVLVETVRRKTRPLLLDLRTNRFTSCRPSRHWDALTRRVNPASGAAVALPPL